MSKTQFPSALRLSLGCCLLLPLAGCGGPAASTEPGQGTPQPRALAPASVSASAGSGVAAAARKQAAKEGKYLFLFFWKTDDDGTAALRTLFDETLAKVADRANAVVVDVTDPAEKPIVDEYGLSRAPMPLVLAVAPNGAITGGFPTRFTEHDLLSAFATPATQACMKSLQDGKLVFLCVQNEQTGMNEEAMRGVQDFAADDRFREASQIVLLDPCDEAEKPFLRDLEIDPATKTAVTVFLAPPGAPIAMLEGGTTKDQFLAELEKAGSCGPGGACGPGGCGPQ